MLYQDVESLALKDGAVLEESGKEWPSYLTQCVL